MTLLGYKVNPGGAREDSRLAPVLHYSLTLSPRLNCRGWRAGKGSVGGVVQPMWYRWFVKGIPERSECQCQSVRELQDGLLALFLLFLTFITESLDCNYMEFLEVQGRKLFSSLR